MIVLDTNVLSEPLRTRPDATVVEWLRVQDDLGTTSVSVGELLVGVRRLTPGRRRDDLFTAIERTLASFERSVLPYDEAAARTYARLQERRRSAGVPLGVEDGMIAAICAARSLTLATRNVRDFAALDLHIVNPWGERR